MSDTISGIPKTQPQHMAGHRDLETKASDPCQSLYQSLPEPAAAPEDATTS